ncbi:MAG: Mur ligase family protein, partial [Candidatus Dormibacteria bacterium]
PETPCFATPESFNTTLGVCRAVNEGLNPEHRMAIVEMGAYRPGEIAEICSFTHPRVGIITAVGVMHLERFGSRQRIALAKSELLAALPEDGVAVLPSDIAERGTLLARLRAPVVWVGATGDRWWAESLELSAQGTSFRLRGSAGEDEPISAAIHGRHAVADLLCALAAAAELGVGLSELVARAAGLAGAPHRLEVSQAGGLTIIDDAYNSNPDGAAEALRLLATLPGQRRVLVTPGYVELGPLQEREMRELGRRAAEVCSHVILVGPRQSAALARGLSQAGYPEDQVTVVASLEQAQLRLPAVAGPGSVVLFENDLPDSFLETA